MKKRAQQASTQSKPIPRGGAVAQIGSLRPNPWNPNVMTDFMREKARASIRQFGFIDPILVRTVPGVPGLEIVDGEQRWTAAKAEGLSDVQVIDLGPIPDHVAKRLTVVLNETRGQFDRVGLSALVSDLLADPAADLAREVLPYTERELAALTSISGFDWGATPGDPTPTDEGQDTVTFERGGVLKVRCTADQHRVITSTLAAMVESESGLDRAGALTTLALTYLGIG